MVLGVKRLGCGGELTKGKNRGEATWGEMVLGRNILLPFHSTLLYYWGGGGCTCVCVCERENGVVLDSAFVNETY